MNVHDNHLLGFDVDARSRRIVLRTQVPAEIGGGLTDVVFEGVVGYLFQNDNLGTILSDLAEVSPRRILDGDREQFKSGIAYCWPGFWNDSEEAAIAFLEKEQIRGFVFQSAIGMCGWVLARSMALVVRTKPHPEARGPG